MEVTGYTTADLQLDDVAIDVEVEVNGSATTYISTTVDNVAIPADTLVEVSVDEATVLLQVDDEDLLVAAQNRFNLTDLVVGMAQDSGPSAVYELIGRLVVIAQTTDKEVTA